jgi:hypothetical protein
MSHVRLSTVGKGRRTEKAIRQTLLQRYPPRMHALRTHHQAVRESLQAARQKL